MVSVTGVDGLARCPWALASPLDLDYHDAEWGVPVSGESAYFERLTLEAFQSGLSWRTILAKRPAFRDLFADFDADVVAAYGAGDVERLMESAGAGSRAAPHRRSPVFARHTTTTTDTC